MLGSSWVAAQLATSREELSSMSAWGVGWDWVHLVRGPLIGLLYQPRMIDDDDDDDHDECGAVSGMRIGMGNPSTRRKPAQVLLRSPQLPHDLIWPRTRAAVVGSRRLTAWAIARLTSLCKDQWELKRWDSHYIRLHYRVCALKWATRRVLRTLKNKWNREIL
jgi:hypothetical protein